MCPFYTFPIVYRHRITIAIFYCKFLVMHCQAIITVCHFIKQCCFKNPHLKEISHCLVSHTLYETAFYLSKLLCIHVTSTCIYFASDSTICVLKCGAARSLWHIVLIFFSFSIITVHFQ